MMRSLHPRQACAAAIVAAAALATLASGCGTANVVEAAEGSGGGSPAVARGDFTRSLLLTGELQAVRSIAIKSPQTSQFQMRIQFLAEEGSVVEPGDPLLDFDNSSLAAQVRDLETQILDAETRLITKRNELASELKDLEIELAEREFNLGMAEVDASVDPSVLSEKEYSERQLALTKARRELEEIGERITLTRDRGEAEVDVLQIDRDKLKDDLAKARNELELLSIKAPARGLVVYERRPQTTLRYQEGDSCWPGQGILRLPDLSEMQAVLMVNEVDAPALDVGMPVEIELDSFPGRRLGGTIAQIPSMAVKRDDSSKIRIFKVVTQLSETWVGEMKPGMSVRGTVVIDRRQDVPLVARSAVRFDGQTYRVLMPGKNGQPKDLGAVEPIARNDTHYVLSEQDYARIAGEVGDAGSLRAGRS